MMKAERYGSALSFLSSTDAKGIVNGLKDDGKKAALLAQIKQVNAEADAFNYLLNGKGPRGSSPFFLAFNKREEPERGKKDEEQKIQAVGAKEGKERFQSEVNKIVQAGGFVVNNDDDTVKGAILVEKRTSKKGKLILVIAQVAGNFTGIKVDQSSDLSGNSFPQWLQEELRAHSVRESVAATVKPPAEATA